MRLPLHLPSPALAAGISAISVFFVSQAGCQTHGSQTNPVEVGTVRWQRDYDVAVAFAQHCFWTGEMVLGGLDGVMRTEAGFLDGSEVTLVDYDPARIPLAKLTRKAKAAGVANKVFTSLDGYRKAPESDQKRQLQGTRYARMRLTPEQATKVNAFVRISPEKADTFLPK